MWKLSCINSFKGCAFSSWLWWHKGQKNPEKTHSHQKPYNFTVVSWCCGTETLGKLNLVTKTLIPFQPLEIWNFSFTPTYLNNVLNIYRAPFSESRSSSLLYGLCHDCTPVTQWCADSESGHLLTCDILQTSVSLPWNKAIGVVPVFFSVFYLCLSVSFLSSTLLNGL